MTSTGYLLSSDVHMGNRLPYPVELTVHLPGQEAPAICHGESDRCGICAVELTSKDDGISWYPEDDEPLSEPPEVVTPTGFAYDDETLYHFTCLSSGNHSLILSDGEDEPPVGAMLKRLASVSVFLELDAGKRYDSPEAPLPKSMGALTLSQLWGESPMPDAAAPYRAR